MMVGSQAAYARHAGISKQAVNKLVKAGKISLTAEGKVDFAEADYARMKNTDPGRRAAIPPREENDTGPVGQKETAYADAKTAREVIRAKIERMEYEERKGNLVAIRDVEDAMVTSARKIRQGLDGMLAWSGELDSAARHGGVDAVRAVLKERLRELEQLLADSMTLLSREDGD